MRFGPFLGIAILLAVLWVCGFLMFHIASGLIHLLLLFAVISLVGLAINLGLVTKIHRRTAIVAHVTRGGTGLMMEQFAGR